MVVIFLVGPVMFGGRNTGLRNRRERLLSAFPYQRKQPNVNKPLEPKSSSSSSPPTNNNTTTTTNEHIPSDGMSSTAKLILETLDSMSTPLRDARKIPMTVTSSVTSRAEKRRMIAEELDTSLRRGVDTPMGTKKRRRPNLGEGSSTLNGPPLRTLFSPVTSSNTPSTSKKVLNNHLNILPKVTSSPPPKTNNNNNFGLDMFSLQ